MVSLPASTGPAGTYFVSIFMSFIATLAVGLRFKFRRVRKMKLGGDDWTILCALMLTLAKSIMVIVGTAQHYFGYHTSIDHATGKIIRTGKEVSQVKSNLWGRLLLAIALGFIKVSVLLFYRRVFQVKPWFNTLSKIVAVIVILWSVAFSISGLAHCGTHFSAWWNGNLVKYCNNTAVENVWFGVTDVVLDLIILAMPIPMIWKLQHVTNRQKIGLSVVFALGLLSTAAAMVRLVITGLIALSQSPTLRNAADTIPGARDLLALNTTNAIWQIVELGAAVTGACLPTLRPLLHGYSPESVVGSIRSALSINSEARSIRRKGSDDEIGDLPLDKTRTTGAPTNSERV
ncbi:hypothetical protein HYFRA_00003783 [Hymenoscyphus fraxineus]|uniref:Rhodopsin domain-containing protein n=1 Tax=Hymenoscyphus fraxineus TaxID=746836 RepID=A0A9N9L2A5_9HELO|nr:hypothetical protein HYFRA_00003783 [Hymenoscyphus fraxineus]